MSKATEAGMRLLLRVVPIVLASGLWTAPATAASFTIMFERNTDVSANELAFRTYATFGDMVANQPSGADQFSPINIAAGFDTSGLMAVWDLNGGGNGGTPVPEPGTLGLLGFGLAGLAATRRRKW